MPLTLKVAIFIGLPIVRDERLNKTCHIALIV